MRGFGAGRDVLDLGKGHHVWPHQKVRVRRSVYQGSRQGHRVLRVMLATSPT